MHRSFLLLCAIFIVLLVSCDQERIYDEYKSFPEGWHKDSTATFNVTGLDTVKAYNVFINLRNNNDYRYSNIFLISEINFPNGKVISDTLEYEMAEASGEWLGTGFGEVKESKLWLKENVRFVEEGDYEFTIQHAMRQSGEDQGVEILEGITEVGVRIEDANTDNTAQ